jgi:adenylate cyclase 10
MGILCMGTRLSETGLVNNSSLLVIGSKVNMAARLMMNYPSIMSCDEETYKAAITKLNKQDFEALPFKPLKGIADPGVIREYNKDHEYG